MEEEKNVFDCLDKSVLTLFNEPSLGLHYTQQHIQNSFPKLLYHMDNLYENKKKINSTLLDMDKTIKDIKELSSLNQNFSFKMLTKINNINYSLKASHK